MMKLILSLTLIWTLSSTAEAVKCWDGDGTDMKQQTLTPCDSNELCKTVAYEGNVDGKVSQHTIRSCYPSALISEGKHIFSVNIGSATMSASVHVCNTDGCNSQQIPYPGVPKKNNLQCFTCDDKAPAVCNKTVQCVGEQDRCISGTVSYSMVPLYDILGCVSANFCEMPYNLNLLPVFPVKFRHAPKCCGNSLCNSAWSVKLNVIPLLFGFITLIVY